MKLLLADPNKVFREIIRHTLAGSSIELLCADNCADTQDILDREHIDFVALTLHLSDGNGISLCQQIRQNRRYTYTPVVLFTAEESTSLRTEAMKAGVTEVFFKKDASELTNFVQRFSQHNQPLQGRVLLVEDSPTQAAILSSKLRRWGLDVDTYPNAEQALDVFRNGQFDLVITDVVLAGTMTGLSLANHIRRLNGVRGDTPILAITAFDDISRRIELFYLGVDDYVLKPLIDEELYVRMRNLLEKFRLIRHEQSRLLAHIQTLSDFDSLTSLPNRNSLHRHLRERLSETNEPFSVVYLDIDQFQRINETFGLQTGDALLRQFALRLHAPLGCPSFAGRISGDEFALVIQAPHTQLPAALSQLELAIGKPFSLGEGEVFLSASLGLSHFPEHGDTPDTLLRNANTAALRAKTEKLGICLYADGMQAASASQLHMETDLRRALSANEFFLCYQPQVRLTDGAVVGYEALLRWQHPQAGLIPPVQFIPVAEASQLIVPLGAWVLTTAAARIAALRQAGEPVVPIAVNLSAVQFRQSDFVETVADIVRQHALQPGDIELELTESVLMQDHNASRQTLQRLKQLGFTLSIDDFGTGYSSLAYLKRFPIDRLKIDRSFVKDLPTNEDDAVIAETIIRMAQSLRLQTVAEGIETREQSHFLQQLGCEIGQGYFYGRPEPLPDPMTR